MRREPSKFSLTIIKFFYLILIFFIRNSELLHARQSAVSGCIESEENIKNTGAVGQCMHAMKR